MIDIRIFIWQKKKKPSLFEISTIKCNYWCKYVIWVNLGKWAYYILKFTYSIFPGSNWIIFIWIYSFEQTNKNWKCFAHILLETGYFYAKTYSLIIVLGLLPVISPVLVIVLGKRVYSIFMPVEFGVSNST